MESQHLATISVVFSLTAAQSKQWKEHIGAMNTIWRRPAFSRVPDDLHGNHARKKHQRVKALERPLPTFAGEWRASSARFLPRTSLLLISGWESCLLLRLYVIILQFALRFSDCVCLCVCLPVCLRLHACLSRPRGSIMAAEIIMPVCWRFQSYQRFPAGSLERSEW